MKMFIVLSLLLVACGDNSTVFVTQKSCTVTQNSGGSLVSCPDGTSAQVSNGIQGDQGQQGVAGQNGTNALADLIKFCPNVVESYPTSFAEYGLCIDNSLYAVFSSGNMSFLTKLVAGTYTTTTSGQNCSFTVVNGCQLQ